MAYLILPSRRTRQPQGAVRVDARYARQGAVVVNYASGKVNLVNGQPPNLVVGTGPTVGGRYGLKREHYTYAADEFTVASTTEFTLLSLMDCSLTAYAGSNCSILGGDDTGNRQFQFRQTITGSIEFIRFSTVVDVSSVTAPIISDRAGCFIAVSKGNSHKCRNVLGWSNTGTIANTPQPITKFSIGGKYNFDATLLGSKTTYLAAFFPWALPDAEIDDLVVNPWQIFASEPKRLYFGVSGGAGAVTGTLSATDGADAASFSGTHTAPSVTGTMAATDGADAASFAGAEAFTGTLAATDGADASAFSGSSLSGVAGTLAATDGADAASFSGLHTVNVTGTLAATEGADLATFTGIHLQNITGTFTGTDGADAAAFIGSLASSVTGTLSGTDGADTCYFYEIASAAPEVTKVIDGSPARIGSSTIDRAPARLGSSSLRPVRPRL